MTKHKYVGLDVHQATTSIAVLDSNGKLLSQSTIQTSSQEICNFIPHQVLLRQPSQQLQGRPRTAFRSPPKDNCWPVRRPHCVQPRRRLLPAREPLVLLDSHCLTCLSSDLDHFWRDCKTDSKPI